MKFLYKRCWEEVVDKLSVAALVPDEVRCIYRRCRQGLIERLKTSPPLADPSIAVSLPVPVLVPVPRGIPGPVAGTPGDLFQRFIAEARGPETLDLFAQLLRLADSSTGPDAALGLAPHARIRRLPLPWRARGLWKLVDARVAHSTRFRGRGLRAAVVGAGPVGLRLAIELRLAGHEVTVIDKRADFSRINRLHLWDWCKADLVSLGAKVFDPPGPSFGANADYCHIGIGELQSVLCKFGLLLGVRFVLGSEYTALRPGRGPGASGAWALCLRGSDGRESRRPFDVLAGADGANSLVARTPGLAEQFGRVEIGLRRNSAIGLVANMAGNPPPGLRQFSLARQFAEARFAQLEQRSGIALENCVYYRSGAQHYLVMTPTPESLAFKGVFHDPSADDLTATQNVNAERVREVAVTAAEHFGLPAMTLAEPPHGAALFDFSGTKRAQCACAFLGGAGRGPGAAAASSSGSQAMAVLVGDALLEPFWPEGLGIMRGFLSALDAVASVHTWALSGADAARRASTDTFTVLKTLNGKIADRVLQPDITQYSVDPRTRYR